MAVVRNSVSRDNTIYPELVWLTNGQTLGTGNQQIFKLDQINNRNQVVKVLGLGIEAHDNSFYNLVVDGTRTPSFHTLDTGGINTTTSVFGGHEIAFAHNQLIAEIANNGSSDTDNRQSIQYIVDANDTMRKKAQGWDLNQVDRDAIEFLRRHPEIAGMDPMTAAKLGVGVPKTFEGFLKIHEVLGTKVRGHSRGTNLSSTETNVANEDVTNKGEEALVLERILIERPDQAEVGEVSLKIYRDNEANALMDLDPACFPGAPFTTDGNTGSTQNLTNINMHVHGFEKLKVTVSSSSGTHNNFKALAVMTRRKLGIGFKAKLKEFLGSNGLPSVIDISSSEQALIDQLGLQQLARTGLISIS